MRLFNCVTHLSDPQVASLDASDVRTLQVSLDVLVSLPLHCEETWETLESLLSFLTKVMSYVMLAC